MNESPYLDPTKTAIYERNECSRIVVGNVPELPFADGTFDVVSAGFVVSHFQGYLCDSHPDHGLSMVARGEHAGFDSAAAAELAPVG